MLRKFTFSTGEFYHIYNRGVNKNNIFYNKTDYVRFVLLLYIANNIEPVHVSNISHQGRSLMKMIEKIKREDTLVDIGAYCLMPNHFHLLIREKSDDGITMFMKKIMTGYSMYINKKYERTGTLFEGRFKAEHVFDDEYLKYLFSYIHLNPVKLIDMEWKETGIKDMNKTKKYLRGYSYSSYLDHVGENRCEKEILNVSTFPDYFNEDATFQEFIEEWLNYKTIKDGP